MLTAWFNIVKDWPRLSERRRTMMLVAALLATGEVLLDSVIFCLVWKVVLGN